MTRRQALLLRAFSAWTVFVFVVLVKNIAKDHGPGHGAAFKAVHYALAVVSIGLAVAAWRVVTTVRRRHVPKLESAATTSS